MVLPQEDALADAWDLLMFTVSGTLGIGIVVSARSEHQESTMGWTPPAVLDRREPSSADVITDWPSPAALQRQLAGPESKRPEPPPSPEPPYPRLRPF
jgi:hypothetical protein